MKRIALAVLTICSLSLVASCKTKADIQVAAKPAPLAPFEILIDWQAEPTYLGVYYAKDLGLYSKLGLEATITQSWGANQAVSAVAAGKYDIATASGGATVLGYRGGAKIVSLAVLYPKIPTVVYGLASSGIAKPKDLEGKRIGIYPGSITKNEFDAFVASNQIKSSKLKIESLTGADIPLLLAGKLDAVLHYTEMSPVLVEGNQDVTSVAGRKTFELRLSDYGVPGYGLNIVTSREKLAKDGDRLKAVAAAMVEGYARGCADRPAATAAFLKTFPEKDAAYVKSSWDKVCDLVGPAPGQQDVSGWQTTIDVYRKLGLVADEVKAQDLVP